MPPFKKDPKVVMTLRHSPCVKTAVDNIAGLENLEPTTMYRKIFNAGLEALYGIKVQHNKIVD